MEGVAPIWNEAIVFDIKDSSEQVIIRLVNERNETIVEMPLNLNDANVRDFSSQNEDIWVF